MWHVDDLHRVSRQRDFIEKLMSRKNAIFNKLSAAILQERSWNRVQQLKVNNNRPGVIEGSNQIFPKGQVNGSFSTNLGVNHR